MSSNLTAIFFRFLAPKSVIHNFSSKEYYELQNNVISNFTVIFFRFLAPTSVIHNFSFIGYWQLNSNIFQISSPKICHSYICFDGVQTTSQQYFSDFQSQNLSFLNLLSQSTCDLYMRSFCNSHVAQKSLQHRYSYHSRALLMRVWQMQTSFQHFHNSELTSTLNPRALSAWGPTLIQYVRFGGCIVLIV